MEVSLKSIILFMIRYVKGTCIFFLISWDSFKATDTLKNLFLRFIILLLYICMYIYIYIYTHYFLLLLCWVLANS